MKARYIYVINFRFRFLLFIATTLMHYSSAETAVTVPKELVKGFSATPNPTVKSFQPILSDPTGNFSLSFLRVNSDQLALAVVHVSSGVPVWRANQARLARWGKATKITFNGSLVITDPKTGAFWSTYTEGNRVVLTSGANLVIQNEETGRNGISTFTWQSFDFPHDTLIEKQNFTSAMRLVSSNGLYSMRLGPDFIGLYAKFGSAGSGKDQIYYRHRALEAKADIVEGRGPILARISSDGFLGMYQNGSVPADIQTFNSYQRQVSEPRLVRVEDDGNLKGYYWSGSDWVVDYQAISEPCELPSPCGLYGLCTPGEGCSCLNNQTYSRTNGCYKSSSEPGDLCGKKEKHRILRKTDVELPFKDLMVVTRTTSYEQCEKSCDMNCTCWGAVYNNASGFCYTVDYPIQTILSVGDDTKMGYFKMWEGPKKKVDVGLGVGIGLLCGAVVVLLGVICLGGYKIWNRNRRVNRFLEEEDIVSPGPYKDLGSTSFGSIELISNSARS